MQTDFDLLLLLFGAGITERYCFFRVTPTSFTCDCYEKMNLDHLFATCATPGQLASMSAAKLYKWHLRLEQDKRLEEEHVSAKNEIARLKMEIAMRERRIQEDRNKFVKDGMGLIVQLIDRINEHVIATHASTTNLSLKRKRTDDSSHELDRSVVRQQVQLLISEKEQMTKQLESATDKARNDAVLELKNSLENELRCGICREMCVKAILLNCMHVFCQSCINEWQRQKRECPTCRTFVTSQSRARMLDNVIDGVVVLSQQARGVVSAFVPSP